MMPYVGDMMTPLRSVMRTNRGEAGAAEKPLRSSVIELVCSLISFLIVAWKSVQA
jgi:hypothetical protein